MERLLGVLPTLLPALLMVGVGMLCRQKRIVQKQGAEGIKAIVINVCVPAVLLRAFYTAAYSVGVIVIAVTMFAACLLALGAGFLFRRLAHMPRIAPFLLTSFEGGLLGTALYALLFDSVADFAVVNLGQALFVWTVYYTWLRRHQTGGRGTFVSALKMIATAPVMIGIMTGVVLGASGAARLIGASAVGGVALALLDFIAAPSAALILIVVGYDLSLSRESVRAVLPVVLVRAALMTVLCTAMLLALTALIPLSPGLQWAIVVMFILPATFSLPMLTSDAHDTAFAAATISVNMVLTLAAFAVIAFLTA